MAIDTILWLKAAHLIGVIGWLGGMIALILALGEGTTGVGTGRRAAMVMDLGATLAIAVGLALLFGMVPSPLEGPNFHIKLTAVVVLIGLHGFLRARLKRVRTGKAHGAPGFAFPLFAILVVVIFVAVFPLSAIMG